MTNETYIQRRDELVRRQPPFVVVNQNELTPEPGGFLRYGAALLPLTTEAQAAYDRFIGLTNVQKKRVSASYGGEGVDLFRRELAQTGRGGRPGRVALVAAGAERVVTAVTPLPDSPVSVASFFDFVELFADAQRYEVEAIDGSPDRPGGVTVRLVPVRPDYADVLPGDAVMTGGCYFRWSLAAVEVGNYYVRLVCANGMMTTEAQAAGRFHRMDSGIASDYVNGQKWAGASARNFDRFRVAAVEAAQTQASLSEVWAGHELLVRHGAPADLAEQLMPYKRLLGLYGGRDGHIPAARAKSDLTMWEAFNRLTDFASHTPLFDAADARRPRLMQEAMGLLNRRRDIQTYYDAFHP